LTNELLTANADTLRTSTQAIRTQIERGVVDIAAVKQANDALIATTSTMHCASPTTASASASKRRRRWSHAKRS
jgi:uncharacterized protein YaaN involved in tellurite resistance